MRSLRSILTLALVTLVASCGGGGGGYDGGGGHGAVDLIAWRPASVAEEEAQSQGKLVLYDFTAAWCGPCRKLEREVFADPASARRINDWFVPVQVIDRQREDGRNSPEVDELQARFQVRSFPSLVVKVPGGPSAVVRGYARKDRLFAALEQVRTKLAAKPD